MSAYLMDSRSLSMLANVCRALGLPAPESESSLYDQLLDENLKSVSYRYPDATRISDWCDAGEAAYIYEADAVPESAARALDLVKEFDYQSCEHPEYPNSFAAAYVAALEMALEPLVKIEADKKRAEHERARAAAIAALKPVDLHSKETAALLRKLLKRAFPACKFSIVTERGSMVSSVRIAWTDGPSERAVKAIAKQFEAGRFDGMTDSYEYDRDRFIHVDGVNYSPYCRYVFLHRNISPALAEKCIAQVANYWGAETVPVAVGGYSGFSLEPSAVMHQAVRKDLDAPHYSWYACIHRAAEDRTAFTRQS